MKNPLAAPALYLAFSCCFFPILPHTSGRMPDNSRCIIVKFTVEAAERYGQFLPSITRIPPLAPLHRKYGFEASRAMMRAARIFTVKFHSPFSESEIAKAYLATDIFEYAEPDFTCTVKGILTAAFTPNDSLFNRQWALYNDGAFSLSSSKNDADIDMELAWESQRGDSSVIVAIFDSGIRRDHPEFNGRIWKNIAEIPGNHLDDDLNGFPDDVEGWDFVNDDNDPSDDEGHGTLVAGIIGANGNNGTGYAGVDWNCKLMACKVIDSSGSGKYSWVGEAVFYAVEKGARVINLSLGGTEYSDFLRDVMTYAANNHVVCVSAMGNNDSGVREYPAALQSTIAVGSTDADDRRSRPFIGLAGTGSNYGNHIDLVAPGNYIYGLSHVSPDNYNLYAGGTSLSTAYVSGVAALLIAQDPSRTPEEIRGVLRRTADDEVGEKGIDVPGFDPYYGDGRLNADRALKEPLNGPAAVSSGDVRIFPNPSPPGGFRLAFVLRQNTAVIIGLVNSAGLLIKENAAELPKGAYAFLIDTGGLRSGLYFLRFSAGKETFFKKCVILP